MKVIETTTAEAFKERKPRTSKSIAQRVAEKAKRLERAREILKRHEAEYAALLELARRQRVELDAVLA